VRLRATAVDGLEVTWRTGVVRGQRRKTSVPLGDALRVFVERDRGATRLSLELRDHSSVPLTPYKLGPPTRNERAAAAVNRFFAPPA
jgi:hypothetical protein